MDGSTPPAAASQTMNFDYLPPRVAALPRDDRGYPIPYIVLRDNDDKPIFTANDMSLVWKAVREGLCHVCGQPLDDLVWFVGGVGSAFLNGNVGRYADGPMHHECLRFAVQYCPHIAGKMAKALAPVVLPRLRAQGIRAQDTTTIPGTPSLFVAVQVPRERYSYEVRGSVPFAAPQPYRKVEYWRDGAMLPLWEARKMAKRLSRELAQDLGIA